MVRQGRPQRRVCKEGARRRASFAVEHPVGPLLGISSRLGGGQHTRATCAHLAPRPLYIPHNRVVQQRKALGVPQRICSSTEAAGRAQQRGLGAGRCPFPAPGMKCGKAARGGSWTRRPLSGARLPSTTKGAATPASRPRWPQERRCGTTQARAAPPRMPISSATSSSASTTMYSTALATGCVYTYCNVPQKVPHVEKGQVGFLGMHGTQRASDSAPMTASGHTAMPPR